MMQDRLVSAEQLMAMIREGGCRVVDCRFDLQHPAQGRHSWLASHIPGAAYADLDRNLAGRVTNRSGRHPLPNKRHFAAFLARIGWVEGLPIVAYDAQGGAFAARFWWLMRYFGHDCVALLDGGFSAWRAARGSLESGDVQFSRESPPELIPNSEHLVDVRALRQGLADRSMVLLDARDADRFGGENETIDPVAGHIPGAVNHPFKGNLDASAGFLAPDVLGKEFRQALSGKAPDMVVHMCGSGVTACHNLFSMELAGQRGSRLYLGSWSEWIQDENRPVATGTN